jgi:hypothetical protein
VRDELLRTKNYETAIKAVNTCLKSLELFGKFTGQLKPDNQTNVLVQVSLAESPEWIDLREKLVKALKAHPEALEAVYEVIG